MTTPTETPVTDTPMTDAMLAAYPDEAGLYDIAQSFNEMLDHARNLERQLTAAQSALASERKKNAKVRDEALEEAAKVCEEDDCDNIVAMQLAVKIRGMMYPVIHDSDCSMHNAPAYEPGPCDCSAMKSKGM